ncbi:PAS domain S-box protein [Candidatus Obscuribacterales bacterium]|nr:PAS domain S-box protein [Candidatus Obscuribacterales bacterium]
MPALISLCAILVMFDLLNQAEAAYQKAAHSRMIYQGVNNVISHVYALAVEIKQTGDSKNPQWERYMPQLVDKYDKVVSEIDDLAELLHEDQEQRHWVKQVKKRFKSLQAGIFEVKSSYGAQAEGGVSRGNQQFKVSMQTIFFDPTFVHLLRIGELERKRFEDNSQQEVKLRKTIELVLGAMLTMTVVVSIAFVSIFVRTIGRRLDILKDNATRLASDVELNPQLSPGDELAPLDEVFHVMAAALKESAKKEQALIENAADTICSLTPQLKVIKINSAAYSLFGVDPDELLGGSLLMQVAPQKREYAREQFEKVIKNSGTAKFDLSHINGENKVREATWSVRWSDEEESLFCIARDMTEQRQAERMKADLVQMISHDIRSPLTAVSAFIDMIEGGTFGALEGTAQKMATKAQSSTNQVLDLVNDFLDLEKMSSGKLSLNIEAIDVNTLFEEALSSVSWASSRGVSVVSEPCKLSIKADKRRIVQVIVNLTSNAVKFSAKGTTVKLSAVPVGPTEIELRVSDQGRGIPEDKIDRLFEKFEQVYASDSENNKGAGLGLSICKGIVSQHGGTIGATSIVGEGSTFWFRLEKA